MRTWPIPHRSWALRMRWCNLLFAHWPVNSSTLRTLLPEGLQLDLFQGRAYIGAVPFQMEGVSPRGMPAGAGFPELNLRTYVTAGGKPGVWFFSLDAGQKLAVRVARRAFHLPYFDAKFEIGTSGGSVTYSAVRTHRNAAPATFQAKYRPASEVYYSEPGTLASWLTERYCLYAADRTGRLYRGDIHHEPWPLQDAEAEIQANTLGDWLGIDMPGKPETLHYAKELNVRAWLIKRVSLPAG